MAHSLFHSSPYQSAVHPFPSMARPNLALAHDRRGNDPRAVSSEPNYLARRALVAVLAFLAVTILAAAFILLAGLGGRPASASQAEPAISNPAISGTASSYVASPGESLWSIAEANHGDVQIDRYVDALIDLNGGTDVQIGQAIRLP